MLFLYFKRFLKSPEFKELINEQVKGGIKTEIKPKHILPLIINLPDLTTQNTIVKYFNVQSIYVSRAGVREGYLYKQVLTKEGEQNV